MIVRWFLFDVRLVMWFPVFDHVTFVEWFVCILYYMAKIVFKLLQIYYLIMSNIANYYYCVYNNVCNCI